MNKQILIVLILCMLFAGFASAADTSAIIGIGSGSGSVTIPITVTNGTNVGSIHVNMTFDPEIVTVTGVTKGYDIDNDMESMLPNLEDVGDGYVQIIAYQVSNPGLSGDFNVANVSFESVSSSGSCSLEIDVITFKDCTPYGKVMAYSVSNGTYTAESDGNGGGGDGTYPPTPTPTVDQNETPIVTPTVTPTTSPSPSPTKTLPDNDPIDDAVSNWGFIAIFVIALILLIAYLVYRRKDGE